MRCAIIADIHSNKYALAAILDEIRVQDVELIINAGDTFGYYPWAQEVYELLRDLPLQSVLGNHDHLILNPVPATEPPSYWPAIEQNRNTLSQEALAWLSGLPVDRELILGNVGVRLVHGTPENPLEGRWYPDHVPSESDWLPALGAALISGHTHYPLIRALPGGGLLLNPGSVGQPRDGDMRPSWIIFDTDKYEARLYRTVYHYEEVTRQLREMAWNERAILALTKNLEGPLRHPQLQGR